MNKQGKNGIEWCDYTWNPVTGCLHGCGYCYAEKIAKRFDGGGYGKEMGMFIAKYKEDAFKPPYVLDTPQYVKTKDDWYRVAPYPFGFAPTFHKYRLAEPMQVKKPSKIFVVSMGDLFGDWVPDEWKYKVLEACQNVVQHTYLFLTKNPLGLNSPYHLYFYRNENFWIGTSITKISELRRAQHLIDETAEHTNRFLSLEPLLGDLGYMPELRGYKWVIIGQQTNPDRPPKDDWVQSIIDQCKAAEVPVFVKSPLYEKFPIQEWPEGLK
jgi:protein gp37